MNNIVFLAIFSLATYSYAIVNIDKIPGLTVKEKSSNSLVFKKNTSTDQYLKEGIIVVGQDKQNGSGFLRRIVSAKSRGTDIDYTTEQVSIAEVVEKGNFSYSTTFSDMPIIDLSGTILYSTNNVQVTITEGTLKFAPELTINADFNWYSMSYLNLDIKGALDVDIDVKLSAKKAINLSKEVNLIPPMIFPIVTYIGSLPVYGKVEVKFPVGIEGTIKGYVAVQTGFDSITPIHVSFIYDEGDWNNQSTIDAFRPNLHYPKYTIESDSEIKVYLKPQVTLTLYEASGAELLTKPYILEKSSLKSDNSIDLRLWGAVDANLRLYLNIFDHNLVDKTWNYQGKQYSLYNTVYYIR